MRYLTCFVILLFTQINCYAGAKEEAEFLASRLYSTCHGGDIEKIEKLYVKKSCPEVSDNKAIYIFGKKKIERLSFYKDSEYKMSGIPYSVDYGLNYEGPLKIFKGDKTIKFRSPTMAMLEHLDIKDISDLYDPRVKLIEIPKKELLENKEYKEVLDDIYLSGDSSKSDLLEKCEYFNVLDLKILKCFLNPAGLEFFGAIMHKNKVAFRMVAGDHTGTAITPNYAFKFKGRQYYSFLTRGESRLPILLFFDQQNELKYIELNSLCTNGRDPRNCENY